MSETAVREQRPPATALFARQVNPGAEEQYEAWVQGITCAAAVFPGHVGTTVIRPGDGHSEYLTVVHFDSDASLEEWLASDKRREWIDKLDGIDVQLDSQECKTGLAQWFTRPGRAPAPPPARYKMAILILLGLYPLVMLLKIPLDPALGHLPEPVSVLASLAASVTIMVWGIMPILTRIFSGWLRRS